jgi:hypothetical protein
MIAVRSETWHDANQRYLLAALAEVRSALERHVARLSGNDDADLPQSRLWKENLNKASAAMPAPPAIDTLCTGFRLSSFERHLLLLCAGIELDSAFAGLCAAAQGSRQTAAPTFSLALSALEGAHWSAATPTAPLRRWRLIEIGTGEALTTSPLRIDERVLHYLAGVSHQDSRLAGLVREEGPPDDLPPFHLELAGRISGLWTQSRPLPPNLCIHLGGNDLDAKYAVAAYACADAGLVLSVIRAADIPAAAAEREALARLWEREALFTGSMLMVDSHDSDNARSVSAFLMDLGTPLLLASPDALRIRNRQFVQLDVQKPGARAQKALWREALGPAAALEDGALDALSAQFNLSPNAIAETSSEVLAGWTPNQSVIAGAALGDALWTACRIRCRARLDDLAQRIDPVATWNEIVLPQAQRRLLAEIAAQARQRFRVYYTWGFSEKSAAGLGITTLFSGPSGTGKTMAAEVLANDLQLDLHRIDLSQVISKYIGETEKNLKRVFDAAEEGGTILLFDEADALFGKRSEVKDSHDRYANIEIGYLLQRMEAYRGLAILTTNLKTALDAAFLRRLRFVVQFPFPDLLQRAEIWRRVFPVRVPTEGLDPNRLARLNVSGGNIRNIALHAAFLAADAGQPVRPSHILQAARTEYAKIDKTLTDSEIAGW